MQMRKLKPRDRESDRFGDFSKLSHIPEPYYLHLQSPETYLKFN